MSRAAELVDDTGLLDALRELLACADHDARAATLERAAIRPALLGSIVAEAMDPRERRQLGAHYTSEADVLKLLRSLFLDQLEARLRRVLQLRGASRRQGLEDLHDQLASLRVLDPACGCGDFLLLAYRELRRIERALLEALQVDIASRYKLSIAQFHGIELLELPAQITRVSLWLLEQQLDRADAIRRPRVQDAHIRCANALRIEWGELLPAQRCTYVIGNPPFIGKKARSAKQVEDMQIVFGDAKGTKALDYVCAWYKKAADYVQGSEVEVAYVSTNSITQGEQPGLLWPLLWDRGLEITFAHRSFPWRSEARGQASVHVVIIGFSARARGPRRIHRHDHQGQEQVSVVAAINPYLVEGQREILGRRRQPLDPTVPRACFGNMPNDGGHLLLSEDQRAELIRADPAAARFVRPLISARQFLAGERRWCLWLHGASPAAIQACKPIMARVEQVKAHRQRSTRAATRKLADDPTQFGERRQPDAAYVLIPRHPSERRRLVPIGYFGPDQIIADSCVAVPGASKYHFGVLSSAMHDAWLRGVGGRIKSDLRYSIELVYNNFPWPPAPTPAQREAVERCADQLLARRRAHPSMSLAALYDGTNMPSELVIAHRKLDAAVDDCYGVDTAMTAPERVTLLLELWRELS